MKRTVHTHTLALWPPTVPLYQHTESVYVCVLCDKETLTSYALHVLMLYVMLHA